MSKVFLAGITSCLMFLLANQGALGAISLDTATTSPVPAYSVQPGKNIEYWALVPARPTDPGAIKTVTGTYLSYEFVASPIASMRLTLRDDSGTVTQYLLSWNTTVNGQPLHCDPEPLIGGHGFCGAMPGFLKPGDTRIAVSYWVNPFPEFPAYRGTDSIQIVESAR